MCTRTDHWHKSLRGVLAHSAVLYERMLACSVCVCARACSCVCADLAYPASRAPLVLHSWRQMQSSWLVGKVCHVTGAVLGDEGGRQDANGGTRAQVATTRDPCDGAGGEGGKSWVRAAQSLKMRTVTALHSFAEDATTVDSSARSGVLRPALSRHWLQRALVSREYPFSASSAYSIRSS